MVNSEELTVTTEYLTLYTKCRMNRCRCNRVRLHMNFSTKDFLCVLSAFIVRWEGLLFYECK
jgi:hypothetical protein